MDNVNRHQWEKLNSITIKSTKGCFNLVKCKNCGITARKYYNGKVIRDILYKSKKYDKCI